MINLALCLFQEWVSDSFSKTKIKHESNVLTFRRKWNKTGKFDSVFECSVKRAEHAEKCEMLKCAVSTPDNQMWNSCQEEKFLLITNSEVIVEKFTI